MATIKASQVKDLRERTGAGMMECKKALTEANGDIEAAIEIMRKAGSAKAVKKSGRIAAEGAIIIKSSDDHKQAVMLEINCETDFVARDENFKGFADQVAATALADKTGDLEKLLQSAYEPGQPATIEEKRTELVSTIGENISIRRVVHYETNQIVGAYLHGSRIGVLIQLNGGDEALAKDLAMQVAASRPMVVSKDDIPEDVLAKEREIYTAQVQESGKPPEIIEKMVEGRIRKYSDEVSLHGQDFIRDPSINVETLLRRNKAEVTQFIRFEVGEGIDKKEENFAEEVMAQVRGDS